MYCDTEVSVARQSGRWCVVSWAVRPMEVVGPVVGKAAAARGAK